MRSRMVEGCHLAPRGRWRGAWESSDLPVERGDRRSDAGVSDGVRTRGQSVPAAFSRTFPRCRNRKRGRAGRLAVARRARARAVGLSTHLSLKSRSFGSGDGFGGKFAARTCPSSGARRPRPAVRRSRLCAELRMELVPVSLSGAPHDSREACSSCASRTDLPAVVRAGRSCRAASPSRVGRVPPCTAEHADVAKGHGGGNRMKNPRTTHPENGKNFPTRRLPFRARPVLSDENTRERAVDTPDQPSFSSPTPPPRRRRGRPPGIHICQAPSRRESPPVTPSTAPNASPRTPPRRPPPEPPQDRLSDTAQSNPAPATSSARASRPSSTTIRPRRLVRTDSRPSSPPRRPRVPPLECLRARVDARRRRRPGNWSARRRRRRRARRWTRTTRRPRQRQSPPPRRRRSASRLAPRTLNPNPKPAPTSRRRAPPRTPRTRSSEATPGR